MSRSRAADAPLRCPDAAGPIARSARRALGVRALAAGLLCASAMALGAFSTPLPASGLTEVGEPMWHYVYGPDLETLIEGVTCSSASDCVAYGFHTTLEKGTAVTTSTGGARWVQHTVGSITLIANVTCTSATTCLAIGYLFDANKNADDTAALILRSTDAGANWTLVTDITSGSMLSDGLTKITCPTAQDCYTIGIHPTTTKKRYLWLDAVSTNGGSTWTRNWLPIATTNGRGARLACMSAQDCVATARTTRALLHTVNGGSSWTKVTLPGFVTDLVCTSTHDCFAAGQTASNPEGMIAVTTDGGITWSDQTDATVQSFERIACPAPSTCLAAGRTSADHRLLGERTVDTGLTWTPGTLYTAPTATFAGKTQPEVISFDALTCPTVTACYADGFRELATLGLIGSVAPDALGPAIPGRAGLRAHATRHDAERAAESTTTTGYVVATTDGGRRWTGQPMPETLPEDMVCLSTANCLMATTDGVLGGPPATPTQGYWEVDAGGDVYSFGTASFHGSMGGKTLNEPIVGMAPTPDGQGYWLVASDGGIFAFGDAGFYGSMGGRPLNKPIVGIASTPDGKGYWEVASDGGIFAFGDAAFHGSMGGHPLNQAVVGIAVDRATGGYWEVAADGGIFSFDAPFFGSTGSLRLNRPIVGMTALPGGDGYWFVASDGGIFSFGATQFYGSMGGRPLNAPISAMASTADGRGYRLVGTDGGLFSFGDAQFYGSMAGTTTTQERTLTTPPPPPAPPIITVATSTASP